MSGFESRYKIGRPRGALMMLMSVGLLIAVIMQAALAAKPVVIGTNYCPERLPINVEPQEYNIELTLLNKFSAVKGKVDIFVHFASVEFKKSKNLLTDLINKISPVSTKPERGSIKDQNNREPTDFIALHMSRHFKILDLELKSASTIDELHESHGQPVSIDNTIEHHRNCEIIKIRLAGETPRLPLGLFGLISIKYESSELPGLYSGAIYDINSGSDRLYHAVHLGKPGEARHLIPCFDELNLKAKIALSVIQPDLESRVLSNMPAEIENESIKIGDRVLYKTKFQQTDRAIPIGSLAFAIGPYKHANGSPRHTRKSVRVGLFEPSGHSNEGNFALDFATKTMIWFLDELKFDRPTVDINLVAVPSLSWNGDPVFDGLGIGLIDLKYLLIDEKLSSPERKIEAALNVALVLARQWFGNVLVPKSNRDLWITEGLAFHLAIRAVRHLRPDFQVDEYVKTHHSWRVLVRYNRNRSKPMHPKSVATDDLVKQVEGEHLIDLFRANIVRDQTRFDRILRGLISGEKESLIGGIDKFTLVEEFKQINFSNEKLSKIITVMMQENAFTPLNVNVLRNTNDHHIKNVVIEYPNRLFYFWQTLRIRVEFACTGPASAELQEKKEVHLHELNWHQRTYEIKPPTWFSWPKQDDNNDPNGCWFHAILGDDAETDQLLPYYLVIYREEEIIRHMGKAIRANNKLLSKRDKIDLLRQLTIEMQEGHTWVKLDETIRYYENERDPDVLLEVLRAIWVHCNYQRRSSRSVELEDFKEQLRTYYDHIGGINKVTGDESMSEQRLKSMLALMLIEANDQQVIQDAKDAFDSIGPDKLAAFQRDPVYRVLSRIDVDDTRGKSLMTRLNLVSLEEERDRIRGRNGLNCESI